MDCAPQQIPKVNMLQICVNLLGCHAIFSIGRGPRKICGLSQPPVFSPILGDFYEGMATTILLPGMDVARVWDCLQRHYEGQKLVTVAPLGGDESVIYASTLAGSDSMRIQVSGHEKQAMVTALFDNLGKGASGAAIQNMNIVLGIDETTGLNLACF